MTKSPYNYYPNPFNSREIKVHLKLSVSNGDHYFYDEKQLIQT